ncbi:MAG TPA: FHA domain-containing serine/threonine-protein kinase [Gemmataceae bacterium]|nr:FHA domain-containing serine/threonine-protein kinase [Gemmataceae bacterium]
MSWQLHIIAGPDGGKALTLQPGSDMMIGRGEKSFYRLSDPRVSRSHCEITMENDVVTLSCHGGSGGTKVNGKTVTKQKLKLGDVIQIGDTQLRLQMGDFPVSVAMGALDPNAKPADGKATSLAEVEALVGKKLGRYDIGPVIIGRGNSSIVFFANDTEHGNRHVALKVLKPEFAQDEEEKERFIRAMKTMMPLRHPNLIGLYGAGKTGQFCWVAMEYIAGETLTEVIKRIGVAGMLDWKHAFRVGAEIGRALEYAHSQNIIHRSVTPDKILQEATTKSSKLGDLMLAKALEGPMAKQITRPGQILGDVRYMSPERTRGVTDLDARADLYGLGATLYALLTGHPPFEGETLVEQIAKIRQNDPVKPTKYQMSIPSAFEGLVLKLLAKKPEDRYQTASEMLKDLERIGKLNGVKMPG